MITKYQDYILNEISIFGREFGKKTPKEGDDVAEAVISKAENDNLIDAKKYNL
jgi:hypothetical protein